MELKFKKTDILAVLLVLLLAAALFFGFLFGSKKQGARAEIYQDGVKVMTLPLDEDTVVVIEGEYTNEITVKDGKVGFTKSNCPNHDCESFGMVNTDGRVLVCLPNGVEVRVISDDEDVDIGG